MSSVAKEYERIDARVSTKPGVHYVPRTKLGREPRLRRDSPTIGDSQRDPVGERRVARPRPRHRGRRRLRRQGDRVSEPRSSTGSTTRTSPGVRRPYVSTCRKVPSSSVEASLQHRRRQGLPARDLRTSAQGARDRDHACSNSRRRGSRRRAPRMASRTPRNSASKTACCSTVAAPSTCRLRRMKKPARKLLEIAHRTSTSSKIQDKTHLHSI